MPEGSFGRFIENFRGRFLQRKAPKIPQEPSVTIEPNPQEPIPTPIHEDQQPVRAGFRYDSARELLRLTESRRQKGSSQEQAIELLTQSPILKDADRESLQKLKELEKSSSDEAVDLLANQIPESASREVRRAQVKWLYDQYNQKTKSKVSLSNGEKKPNNGEQEMPKIDEAKEDKPKKKYPLTIWTTGQSITVENEDQLKQIVSDVKSEFTPDEMLEKIDMLTRADPKDLMIKFKKRVAHGKFEGFQVLSGAGKRRILFRIEKDGTLSLRLGKHDEIYAGTRSRSSAY